MGSSHVMCPASHNLMWLLAEREQWFSNTWWHNSQSVCWHKEQDYWGVSPGLKCFWCLCMYVFVCPLAFFHTRVNVHVPGWLRVCVCLCVQGRVQACCLGVYTDVFHMCGNREMRQKTDVKDVSWDKKIIIIIIKWSSWVCVTRRQRLSLFLY